MWRTHYFFLKCKAFALQKRPIRTAKGAEYFLLLDMIKNEGSATRWMVIQELLSRGACPYIRMTLSSERQPQLVDDHKTHVSEYVS